MYGGSDNDTYIVNSGSDTVTEYGGEGIDTVRSYIPNYTLGANVEYLQLSGAPAVNGTGNGLNNFIYGNSNNNILKGMGGNDNLYGFGGNDFLDGGPGVDNMYGGSGNDRYIVNSSSDKVVEANNQGTDQVDSYIHTYILDNNVEGVQLFGPAIAAYGNSKTNALVGNANDNVLSGGNGGSNVLSGGAGDDTIYAAFGNDVLVGGADDDHLTGGGGFDIMTGGTGADVFALGIKNSPLLYTGVDYAVIQDFFFSDGDKVQLKGVMSDYTVIKGVNLSGGNAYDTIIQRNSNTIGIIEDTTVFSLGLDVNYV